MQSVDDLATVIIQLDPSQQEALLEKLAQLNFQKGLNSLAEKYRTRLARENQLQQSSELIWADLLRIREQIADHDYPA